jgi:hypothetical protein
MHALDHLSLEVLRCETIFIGTSDCGRLTHERVAKWPLNGDRVGHRCQTRQLYTNCYANWKSSNVDG